jgi:hypothetical protein
VTIGVAGPARDRAPVDAAGDELGDHEVAEVVEAGTHAEAGGELLERWLTPSGLAGLLPSTLWENT